MNKLDFYGVGPKIGRIVIPWLVITLIVSFIFKGSFKFFPDPERILFYSGSILIIIGLIMYLVTVPMLLKGIKNNTLVTRGAFYLCCNPLYASIILFIIPGVSFMMNSWLVLSTSVIAYIVFKVQIKGEEKPMKEIFGEDYIKYRSSTPEFFPLPFKKILHRK